MASELETIAAALLGLSQTANTRRAELEEHLHRLSRISSNLASARGFDCSSVVNEIRAAEAQLRKAAEAELNLRTLSAEFAQRLASRVG